MLRSMLLLSLALSAASLPVHAQEDVDPDSVLLAAVIANGPTLSEQEAGTRCLDLPGGWLREDDEEQPWLCEPQESGELERAGDRRYFWTRYSRTAPADPDDFRDTLREDHVVLFSAPLDGSRLTAEWHARYDLDLWTGVHLQVGPTEDGGALLSVVSCVNGTAGCGQNLLLRRGDGWRVVRQAWLEQLPDSVAGEFWKGTYINPMTLQGRAPLYGEDDANCCPSRMLYVRVRLQGDALVLRDYRAVEPGEP
jgi:hypothetical protein